VNYKKRHKACTASACSFFVFFDVVDNFSLISFLSLLVSVISLNLSEENKRVHERVDALTNLEYFDEVFWKNQSKAATITKFQDRVQQVHRFFDKCYTGLKMIWKTIFPLNEIPPTLLTLMSKFSNAKKVRKLVRCQLLAGAESSFAFVLSKHPSLDLMAIANVDGDVSRFYPAVKVPAFIVIDRMEDSSKVDVPVEIP
jgi:hypothetical protein